MDWHRERLTPGTAIDDSFRVTPNVRRFFAQRLGPKVRLNRAFHAWARSHRGSTLHDAVVFLKYPKVFVLK